MGGLISKELDNKTIISKLEELESKMANWIKKQQNNKDSTQKENLEWEIKEKLNKLKELDKSKEKVKLEKNPEEIKKIENNIKNIDKLIKEQINKVKNLNKLNKELIEARKAKSNIQINETNQK